MAEKPPLPHEEVQRILRRLEPLTAERRVILVGGQAVSFWMRMLQPYSDELASVEPVTSKEIDFEGGAQAVRRAGELLVEVLAVEEDRLHVRPLEALERHPDRRPRDGRRR